MGRWLRHHSGDVGLTARAATQECTQIGENGPSAPFRDTCVHCWAVGLGCGWVGIATVYTNGRIGPLRAVLRRLCTLLRLARIVRATVGTQECTQIGGNGPLGAVLGHLCTLLRRKSRYESRRELRQVARAPQPPWRVGASSLAPLAWSGRQTLSERRRCQVGILAEALTHTNP